MTEDRSSELEDSTIHINQYEQEGKTDKLARASGTCRIITKCSMFVSESKKDRSEAKKLSEGIIAENFPKLVKQKTYRIKNLNKTFRRL